MIRSRGGSAATVRPAARGNERGYPGEGGSRAQSARCRVPGGSALGNWLLAIPKASKNGRAGADFIAWVTSAAVQRTYAEAGGIPSRKSLLNDPAMNEKNPYFAALAKSLEAVPNWRPRTDQWNAVETILGTNLNAALAGLSTPEDAMSKAAGEIRALMKKAGY
jgi:multiple sugar transport system substrate-binding protein